MSSLIAAASHAVNAAASLVTDNALSDFVAKIAGSALRGAPCIDSAGSASVPRALRPRAAKGDVAAALLDLRLPDGLARVIEPLLRSIGMTLRDDEAQERYGRAKRKFTVAEGGAGRRVLVHLPGWLLSNYDDLHRDALLLLPHALPQPSRISIFSEPLDVVEQSLNDILENEWRERNLVTFFVPWRWFEDLKADSDPDGAERRIKKMLQLDGIAIEAALPLPKLTPGELQTIATALSRVATFEIAKDRSVAMAIAGLEGIFSDFSFEGDKESIANGAVLRLHKYGWCRDPADAHALGLLIEYICGLPAVNEAEKKPLREIEKKHSLFPRP